jgi:hypothetical protein
VDLGKMTFLAVLFGFWVNQVPCLSKCRPEKTGKNEKNSFFWKNNAKVVDLFYP